VSYSITIEEPSGRKITYTAPTPEEAARMAGLTLPLNIGPLPNGPVGPITYPPYQPYQPTVPPWIVTCGEAMGNPAWTFGGPNLADVSGTCGGPAGQRAL